MSHRSDFTDRHIGPNQYQIQTMLLELGFKDLDSFIKSVVPNNIHIKGEIEKAIPSAISETAALAEISEIAKKNSIKKNFIGSGYYGTITPAVILRNVLENPGWYTAYTPYQPEIAQGRLEAIFAFQTAVTDLTGLDIANASMLDEATATAEAMTLARRVWQGSDEAAFVIDTNLHPHVKAVVHTRAKPLKIKVIESDFSSTDFASDIFAVVIAYPNSTGEVKDISKIIASVQSKSALVIVNCDLLALTLFKTPGEYGADIAVGSAQRFGVPVGYGGPHAGFLAVRTGLERSLPGRLVGQSVDTHGNLAFRLALQTREQHIRRDKATSNICTAQVLLAVIAAFYTMWHGPQGLKAIASRVQGFAYNFRGALRSSGFDVANYEIFDTVLINTEKARQIFDKAAQSGFNIRLVSNNSLSVSFDEQSTENDLSQLLTIFGSKLDSSEIPASNLARKTDFLSHPIFNTYHSETAMLRHIRTLSDRDLALDRTMIPLGSCTMKLNATSEMIPITWPEFNSIHPFGPADQAAGYTQLIKLLSDWLVSITGYDAVSLQPNAGSQGEFAGLLAIRNYLDSKGESARDICLIPSSAHGTNAASAVMAGMKVIVIACDENGNVSLEDLKLKITQYRSTLAALMVTYPSTHGVFESAISQICEMIHDAGGQVYVDGANLNALVGVAKPGKFGADVSHLNLHKTFCIPHGGGGPGMGPIGVAKHLTPFLPGHTIIKTGGSKAIPAVSAAPYGSASILLISHAYIAMMGGDGLTNATKIAILNANYIKSRLEKHYQILYAGSNGRCAHEMIVDCRMFKNFGIEVTDIAKRLMDYGFHAPTVSFPVAGTIMIEPTESEPKSELDRFCDALISIYHEIQEVEQGNVDKLDNVLKNAPHTAAIITGNEWNHSYTRQKAAYPLSWVKNNKFWPSVGRVNDTHGDRTLICACPPIESYAE